MKMMRDAMIKIKGSSLEAEKNSESETKSPIIEERVCENESIRDDHEENKVLGIDESILDPAEEPGVKPIEESNEGPVEEAAKGDVPDPGQEILVGEITADPVAISLEQDEMSDSDRYCEAVNLYRLGLAGDKEAVVKAFELLKAVLQKDPENHLAQAYLGSATSLLGRDVADPNERFKYAIQGLKILDKVVALEPDSIEIRGLRAFLCGKLPEQYFHRSDTAIEDFAYLIGRYEEDDSLFPKEFYCQLMFELGLAYNRLDKKKEAESICLKLLSLTDDPKYEALLKEEGILASKEPKWQKQAKRGYAVKSDWAKAKGDEKLQEAITLHRRALDHDMLAVEKAFDIFKQAHRRNPQDPLIRAYYADCLSLMAQNSADTSVMFRHATHAIKNLDQAVNADPDNITIRLLRGYNSFRIPEAFFKRTLTAIHDFNYLINKYKQDPTVLEQETYLQLLYDLGQAYDRLDLDEEAKIAWTQLSQSGDSKYNTLAKELLGGSNNSEFHELGENPSVAELLQEGIRLYELASGGNKKAGLKAQDLLRRACIADPLNSLAEGYYGISLAVAGQNSTDPTQMFRGFFKGLNHLKKAVARDPKDFRLHLLLANLFHNLSPSFFPANDKAIKEFKFLKMAYEKDKNIFSEEMYFKVLYDLGMCYQAEGDTEKAHKTWEKLSKITADPKFKELGEVKEEGDAEMTKDLEKVQEKYKEIAEELARERIKERSERKDKKRSKDNRKEESEEESEEESKEESKEETSDQPKGKSTRKHRKKDRKKAFETAKETPTARSKRRDKKRTTEDQPVDETTRKLKKKEREMLLEKVKEMTAVSSKRRDKKKVGADQPEGKLNRKLRKKEREEILEMVKTMIIKKGSGHRDKDKADNSGPKDIDVKPSEIPPEDQGA
jgi:hypothetical protein